MKPRRIITGILAALLLVGCGPVENASTEPKHTETSHTEPSAPEQTYTPGELTYYVNLPQSMHWSLSTYMESDVYAVVLSSKKLDSFMNSVLEDDLFANNGGMLINPLRDETAMEYPLYLYQTYRGMDWEQMAKLKQEAEAGNEDSAKKLKEYEQMYADDFAALTAEDLPEVYPYLLHIQTGYDEANFAKRSHSVEIQFGEDAVTVPLGTLDVTDLPLWEGSPEAEELPQKALDTVQVSYWTDTAELPAVQIKGTSEPQVLTGLAYLGGEVKLSDICLTWEENGETVIHQWDGATPITIPAFTEATLSATLHHAGKSVMGYCAGGYLAISRECEGKNQRLWYSLTLTQYWNVYELYAMVVDGLDLAPYYTYVQDYTPAEAKNAELEPVHTFDKLLLQQDGFSVTALSAYADDFGYTLTLAFENTTETNAKFLFGRTLINGYLYPGNTAFKVPAKGKVTAEYTFPWEEMGVCGITERLATALCLLELKMTVWDENSHLLLDPGQLPPLFIQETEKKPEIKVTPGMTKLVDAELYELWVVDDWIPQTSIFDSNAAQPNEYWSQILFVNKSKGTLLLTITEAVINGEAVDAVYACSAKAGRFVMDEYIVFQPSDYRWTVVEEITISFEVESADGSWIEKHSGTYHPSIPLP